MWSFIYNRNIFLDHAVDRRAANADQDLRIKSAYQLPHLLLVFDVRHRLPFLQAEAHADRLLMSVVIGKGVDHPLCRPRRLHVLPLNIELVVRLPLLRVNTDININIKS